MREGIVIKTAYDKHERQKTYPEGVSLTKQSFQKEADINNIVKKYQKTGVITEAHNFEGLYGDFTAMDFREAIHKAREAEEIFMEVPSKIRLQFDNDPGAFIDFATNPENITQMRDWGLASPEEQPPAPVQVEVVNATEPNQEA
jgi:phage internal scaffolding protein